MSGIATIWNTTRGDWSLAGADLARGTEIVTAVLISLFTDRTANPDDTLLDASDDPRGWWAADIGSRLWLITRAKRTAQTIALAQGYVDEALQWLIDDGVASRIDTVLEWTRENTLGAQITVYAPASAAYGPEPIARLDTANVFRLGAVQAWGWDGDIGAGQWVAIAPQVPQIIVAVSVGAGSSRQAPNTDYGRGMALLALFGSGASSQAANTDAGAGHVQVPSVGAGAGQQAPNTDTGTGSATLAPRTGTGADTQAHNVSAGIGVLGVIGSGAGAQARNVSAGAGLVFTLTGAGASTQAPNADSGAGIVSSAPADPYFADVIVLMHGDTSFVDSSTFARTFTASGGPVISTADASAYGGSSMLFNGSGSLTTPTTAELQIGTPAGAWSVQLRMKTTQASNAGLFTSTISGDSGGYGLRMAGGGPGGLLAWTQDGAGYLSFGSTQYNDGAWHEIEISHSGITIYLFVDGALMNSSAGAAQPNDTTSTVFLLGQSFLGEHYVGQIEEFRITKGVGRHTAAYTADTAAYPDH